MKILKEVHRRLMQFADLHPAVQHTIYQWGKNTFKKTQYNNHIGFLRDCLQHRVVPRGFIINSHHTSSTSHVNKMKKATDTCSKRLMRISLHEFCNKMHQANILMRQAKQELQHQADSAVYLSTGKIIHQLNRTLHFTLVDIKKHKLQSLLPHTETVVNEKSVVTIPSDVELSPDERSVLSKGLFFIPTPKYCNEMKLKENLSNFYRRVKLHAHFNNPNEAFLDPEKDDDPFDKYQKPPSTWEPSVSPSCVVDFVNKCNLDIKQLNLKKKTLVSNITDKERTALRNLRLREDIIIKPADKGGSIVVWKKDNYIEEAERQLSDSTFYEKLQGDTTLKNNELVSKTIKDEIGKSNLPSSALNLITKQPRCSKFYLLPKIHKPSCPGRPIVSACSCPTEYVSAYLDNVLKDIVSSLPTFVKDSTHVLNILKNIQLPKDEKLLFTMDVSSLYTNIPHADGLKALQFYLDQRNVKNPPTNTLIRLAELVLTLNVFEFNQDYYHQINGVSMGSRFGPSYACLFMGYLESKFLQQYTGTKPELFLRYIDDIMGVTTMTKENLEKFIQEFNNFHPSIRVTSTISEDCINFLDISILNGDTLSTTVFYKETDSHNYLNFRSFHPDHCKRSIPYSQFLRLRRLCSDEEDFARKTEEMKGFFRLCGYPANIIANNLRKCETVTREQSLTHTKKTESSKIPLVLMYDSTNMKVSSIIHKNYQRILSADPDLGSIFTDNLITAFSNHSNIKKAVVRSGLPTSDIPGTFSCSKSRCITCQHVVNNTEIQGPSGSFKVSKSFTCTSKSLIYCIICLKCGILYIGETGRELKDRIREHVRDVKNRNNRKEVALHFNSADHTPDDLGVFGVYYCKNQRERRLKESELIQRLGTLSPLGLNRMDDYNYIQ